MHFIGSILSSASGEGADAELVLIDGQQRTTTLMLLVAALHHTVRESDPALADELQRVLVHSHDTTRTKLRPHRAWASVFERVVLDLPLPPGEQRDSRFDDNYAFFRSQISRDEAAHIWRGLQKLEHVAITLGGDVDTIYPRGLVIGTVVRTIAAGGSIARDAATVADSSDEAIESANAVNGSLDMTQTALERANAAAAGIALQVGAAEAAVTQALATLREAS